jgi:hypothetical protein
MAAAITLHVSYSSSDEVALLMSLKARGAGTNSAGGVWLLIEGLKAFGGLATAPTRDAVGTTALLETRNEAVRRVQDEARIGGAEKVILTFTSPRTIVPL